MEIKKTERPRQVLPRRLQTAFYCCLKKSEKVYSLLEAGELPRNDRSELVYACVDIALEHQKAIVCLVKNNMFGSASALVRPVYETLLRALWINGCAGELEIKGLRSDPGFQFPGRSGMLKQIAEAYRTDLFSKLINEEIWQAMCGYTHSGLQQLSRRFSADGSFITPNYSEGEVLETLYGATLFMLFAAHLAFKIAGRTDAVDEMERLIGETLEDLEPAVSNHP
jgi:hypothetical protein